MAKPSKYTYYPEAKVVSEMDGSEYTLGMTVENLSVEICGNTHPFYTGKQALIDTAGRIEKFQAKMAKADPATSKKKKTKARKVKLSITDLVGEEPKKTEEVAE